MIVPAVFSNVCLRPVSCLPNITSVSVLSIHDSPFGLLSNVCLRSVSYPILPVFLDCPFMIAPSVFSHVCLRPVSCLPNITSVSGLSIHDNPFGFL